MPKPRSCYVYGCPGDTGDSWEGPQPLKFYTVPSVISERNKKFSGYGREQIRKEIIELSRRRRKAWLQILRRESVPDETCVKICQRHFVKGRPAGLEDQDDPDWVPSVNVGSTSTIRKIKTDAKRRERHKLREQRAEAVSIYGGSSTDAPVFIEIDPEIEEVMVPVTDDESETKEVATAPPEPSTTERDGNVDVNAETPVEIAADNAYASANATANRVPTASTQPKEKHGHWHVHFCTKKACLYSKEAAKYFSLDAKQKEK